VAAGIDVSRMNAVKLAVAAMRIIVASAIKQATRKSAANPRMIKNIARFGLNEGTKTGIQENDPGSGICPSPPAATGTRNPLGESKVGGQRYT
jgi:hypothetical protein